MSEKLIFLDIDGVICCNLRSHLQPKQLNELQRVAHTTGARIVLSSDWRRFPDAKREVKAKLADMGMRMIGVTPILRTMWARPREITQWLDKHNRRVSQKAANASPKQSKQVVSHWVAIDDRFLLQEVGGERLEGHFVRTLPRHGLTAERADACIALLGGAPGAATQAAVLAAHVVSADGGPLSSVTRAGLTARARSVGHVRGREQSSLFATQLTSRGSDAVAVAGASDGAGPEPVAERDRGFVFNTGNRTATARASTARVSGSGHRHSTGRGSGGGTTKSGAALAQLPAAAAAAAAAGVPIGMQITRSRQRSSHDSPSPTNFVDRSHRASPSPTNVHGSPRASPPPTIISMHGSPRDSPSPTYLHRSVRNVASHTRTRMNAPVRKVVGIRGSGPEAAVVGAGSSASIVRVGQVPASVQWSRRERGQGHGRGTTLLAARC